ncbi:hypothetical protein SAMN05444374_11657 [Rhodococcoides kroppenstedtii]|uniref:Uncharacterized protein n=1 Tax=Rhodococcoides kroppenstedtii TaxID=293050 RepID=A0A1I0UCC5_9NOCA|nr:hypothetical protein [Rhodococcus kroppenstedtii]SFA60896.1 hypothetical protein SAMN05444374_11657 [Rhodococcus kroppenstedtii]
MTSFSDVQAADIWWATQNPERKCQIHRWIDPAARGHHPVAGQFELDLPDTPDAKGGTS